MAMLNNERAVIERPALLLAAGALALLAFFEAGRFFSLGWVLDLGSLNFPTPRYVLFVGFWALFGGIAVALMATGVSEFAAGSDLVSRLRAQSDQLPDRRFLLWTSAAAFIIPVVLRTSVLHGAPLTDDESAYRFAADLLASGRLWVPSPPLKIFFDQNFMVNDGRMFPVYFLGWPSLLAIGVLLHIPSYVNPILSALTVPALLRVLRHLAGPRWARAGVVLFLSAPMLQIAAATGLSHTACLMALAWAFAMLITIIDQPARTSAHALFAFTLALAFTIRPQSVVALGLPMLFVWVGQLRRVDPRHRLRAIVSFLVPAVGVAVLFLTTLWLQTGSPFRDGYSRYNAYMVQNGFRFTSFVPEDLTSVAGFDFADVPQALARTASGLFRLNFDLFGWPSSFAILILALPLSSRRTAVVWSMALSFLLLTAFQRDWGVDTFGPLHAFELALPLLVLTIVRARDLTAALARVGSGSMEALPGSLLLSLIVCAWIGFAPVRLQAIRQITATVNEPFLAVQRAGLHNAIVFAPLPFAPPCGSPRHFVLFRPVNDPDLRNDILWVNHIDLEGDRRLAATMPGRSGYVMQRDDNCQVTLTPIATAKQAEIPRGRIRP